MIVEVRAEYKQDRNMPYIPEGQISPTVPFHFDYVNMETILAYSDMFTLDQLQMLFVAFSIPCRERTKLKMATQFYRATIDHDMPTAKMLRTLRAIAIGQYPIAMPQEVVSYHRCAMAIKLRTICADPEDNRPTPYVNNFEDILPVTALNRVWKACLSKQTPREIETEHYENALELRGIFGHDFQRTMAEYDNDIWEQFQSVPAPQDDQRTRYMSDDDDDSARWRDAD